MTINKSKYKFREYSEKYVKFFDKEKKKLYKLLGSNVRIEHIGSTSVPGLGGKGIVDLVVATNKRDFLRIKKLLVDARYLYKEHWGNKNRLSFMKDYFYFFGFRRVHVHVVNKESSEFSRVIKFRNKLRADVKLLRRYAGLKKRAVAFAKGESEKYISYKNKFIKKHSR